MILRVLSIGVATTISCASPGHADSICGGLKSLLADARNEFKKFKGDYDFERNEYRGRLVLGSLNRCSWDSGKGVSTYECSRDLPDDEDRARRLASDAANEIERCFGNSVRRRPHPVPSVSSYDYLPTEDPIEVRYRCTRPKRGDPYCYVSLDITRVDENQQ